MLAPCPVRSAWGRWPASGGLADPSGVDLTPAELAVRFGCRPWTVRAIILCGPAPIRWRAGRPLVQLDEFTVALDPWGGAREGVTYKNTPGARKHPRGLNRHPYPKGPEPCQV
jgi:hypothetical protein